MISTATQGPAVAADDQRPAPGAVFAVIAVLLGGFTLWSAGPGLITDHVRLTAFLAAIWVLVLLSHDARGRFHALILSIPAVLAGALATALFAALVRQGAAFMSGEALALLTAAALVAAFGGAALARGGTGFALAGVGLYCLWYYQVNFLDVMNRAGAWTASDLVAAAGAVAVSLEVARRGMGMAIPLIALVAVGYAYFGPYMPYDVAHRGVPIPRLVNYLFYSQEGLFGIMTSVMANYVLVFILLGAFMNRSGMGQFFINLPMALAGRSAGGPAKVAVVASGIFGSISGSSLANIVSTGTFTIPLMKKVGFRPAVAGAVENSASLGGQLLPPVMGAGVFVMSEITGIPYIEIVAVATAPALLYFASILLIVHFEARKTGVGGLPEGEMVGARHVFLQGWFHIIPFAVLIGFLVAGYSPDWCALMAIAAIVLINWLRHAWAQLTGAPHPAERLDHQGIFGALVEGVRNALVIGSIAAAIGIIVGMIALTGFGLKMSMLFTGITDGALLPTLALIALTSLVLGMALPITAAYLVLVVIAAPALENLGVPLIAAHMIVFWLSQDSNITPPVCLGAFVAASIAGAKPWPTAWLSFRFAKMLYVMPILFAYTPILFTGSTETAVWTIATACIGTIAFSAWTMGYLLAPAGLWGGAVLALCAFGLFWPVDSAPLAGVNGLVLNIAGAVGLGLFVMFQKLSLARAPTEEEKEIS